MMAVKQDTCPYVSQCGRDIICHYDPIKYPLQCGCSYPCANIFQAIDRQCYICFHPLKRKDSHPLRNYMTPIQYAIYKYATDQDMSFIKFMIDNGIAVNDECKTSPLHYAVIWGDNDLVEYLIFKGANVNKQNHKGKTPIFISNNKVKSHDVSIMKTLVKNGADLSLKNNKGETIVDILKRKGQSETIIYFKI